MLFLCEVTVLFDKALFKSYVPYRAGVRILVPYDMYLPSRTRRWRK